MQLYVTVSINMSKDTENNTNNSVLQANQAINFSVLPPLLSREHFASFVGTTLDTVRGWAQTNTIPTVKVGRHRLINVVRLMEDLSSGKSTFSQGDYRDG
jgi:excisionase family DNA binding protein